MKKRKKAEKKKASVKKKSTAPKKRKAHAKRAHSISRSSDEAKVERVLVENFVSLQRAITNQTIKFDHLAKQISDLLNLFETTAEAISKKDFSKGQVGIGTQEIVKKMDNLADQNKVIARGLTLLHSKGSGQEKIKENVKSKAPEHLNTPQMVPKQLAGYQKSISANPEVQTKPVEDIPELSTPVNPEKGK